MARVTWSGESVPLDTDKSHYTEAQRRVLEARLEELRRKREALERGGVQAIKPDQTEKIIESELARTMRRLREVYAEASEDLKQKAEDFARGHARRVQKYREMVERGEITQADFDAWMQGQLFQEQAWKQKREQMARLMAEADAQAVQIVNDGKYRVFEEGANYLEYELEHEAGTDLGFGLYDQNAVNRLIRDDPQMLPPAKVDKGRDERWYNRMIQSAVTQGILQGETLEQITLRVSNEVDERSLSAMRRNARTAYRSAMNAGQQEGMRRAAEMGIEVRKRWECTFDDSTRDAHQKLDGQEVPWDEPFESILGPIMYPCDPSADPANVYGCRCRMRKIYPQYNFELVRRDTEGNDVGGMTYAQWKAAKGG